MQTFDPQTQKHMCAYLVRDAEILAIFRPDLHADLFENEILKAVVRVTLDFYDRFKSAPDQLIIHHVQGMAEKRLIPEKLSEIILELCRELLAENLQNRDWVLENYDKMIQQLKMTAVMREAVEHAKAGEYEKVREVINRGASSSPMRLHKLYEPYIADPTARIERRRRRSTEEFRTLLPEFDNRRVYIKRGELGIVQGGHTGVGKSALFVHLARNYAFQNYRSLICTLELSREDFEDRLDMCFSSQPDSGIANAGIVQTAIRRMMAEDNMIVVRKFPAHSTVAQLQVYSQRLADTAGFRPDLVFVDYDSLLHCGDSALTGNQHLADKRVYEDLREWAVSAQIGMWVASQSTKRVEGKDAEISDMSGSACKAQIADLAFSINRDTEDEVLGQTRINVTKGRHGAKLGKFTIPTDLDRMQFYASKITAAAVPA